MKKLRVVLFWILVVLSILFLLVATGGDRPEQELAMQELAAEVDAGALQELRVDGAELIATRWDGSRFAAYGVPDEALYNALSAQGVWLEFGPEPNPLRTLLIYGIPVLMLLALVVWFLRKVQGGGNNAFALRESRARLASDESKLSFDDVAGAEDAKELLRDMVDFLQDSQSWIDAGVRLPRGVLLEGPPGCGKTLLARAVAGEAGVPFYLVSASEFVEMFVGVGAARVRDMFETAAKEAPAVIFIDELDAVGRRRGSGVGLGHDEREQTLNQILVSMDGFEQYDQLVVLAATNRADVLDAALLRPGRFDQRLLIPLPDAKARVETLEIHSRGKALADDVDFEALVPLTEGFSGAALEHLANAAGMLAVRRARKAGGAVSIQQADFLQALEDPHAEDHRLDHLDSVIVESATQLVQPTVKVWVRLILVDDSVVEGELMWADAAFIKVRREDGEEAVVLKLNVTRVEGVDTGGIDGAALREDPAPPAEGPRADTLAAAADDVA